MSKRGMNGEKDRTRGLGDAALNSETEAFLTGYRSYMERVEFGEDRRRRLLDAMELEGRGAARPRAFSARRFRGALGLCAAAVLVICLLLFTGGPDRSETMEDPPGTGLPQVAFGDVTGEDQIAMSIAFPDGSFQEDLTLEQIKGLFGGGEGVLEALGWEGLNPKGYVIYDGKGEVFWVVLYGEGMEGAGDPSFTMTLANGAIPPDCVVYEETGETVVRGTTVYGNYWNYDQDGDQIEEHVYEASFLAGETGVRFECAGHDQETAEALALAVVQLCTEEPGASLSKLAPEFVPEWRSEKLRLEEARAEEGFGQHVPAYIPAGFGFGGAFRELGQERDWLSVEWHKGYNDLVVTIRKPFDKVEIMDPKDVRHYDVTLYETPWADSVPEDVYDSGFENPVFRYEDLTAEIIRARGHYTDADSGDEAGYRFLFSVLYEDGLVAEYDLKGVTPEEVVRMLL